MPDTIASIFELNTFLSAFKKTLSALVPFDTKADEDNRADQKRTYQENQKALVTLYMALVKRSQNKIATGFDQKSTTGIIGTVGMLCNGSMLNYSEQIGSQYCFQGVNLKSIQQFKEI